MPYINGKLRWKWPPIYQIADAMRIAAREMDVTIRWGGAWDIDFTAADDSPEDLVIDYTARRKKAGKKPLSTARILSCRKVCIHEGGFFVWVQTK